jgi:acetolactate synthase-1/2/3 large subunit
VSEADLVLFVGSHTGSQVTLDWKIPAMGTPIIQIDIDPSELGRNYPTQVAMQGDAKASVRRLIDAMEPMGERKEWVYRAQQLVKEWRDEVDPLYNSDAVPILPQRLCNELTKSLPSDAILLADTGHAGIWTGSMVDLKHPEQSYLRAAGSLGWGLAAALGAKCAAPERPVICFTGDGGFWYHIGELETAVRHGINAVTVVNNNRALSQNMRGDLVAYQGYSGNPTELFGFTNVDISKIAESMGCFGIQVTDPNQIQSAIEQALASGRPAVVEVITDIEEMAPVPWGP